MSDDPAPATNKEDGGINPIPKSKKNQQRKPRGPRYPKKDKTEMVSNVVNNGEEEAQQQQPKEVKLPSNKKCKYFKATGRCRFGDRCLFKHVYQPKEGATDAKDEEKAIPEDATTEKPTMLPEQVIHMPSNPQPRRNVPSKPVKIILKLDQTGSQDQKKARELDILYFKRRFPGTIVKTLDDGTTSVTFTYRVSNPEWVFDVNTVTFILSLAPEHPISAATLDIEQGMMPSPLQIYLIKKFNDVLKEKHASSVSVNAFEPIGKWFIREVDKYILEFFIVGLKRTKWLQDAHASGMKVTVFEKPEEVKRELTKPETLQQLEEKENGHQQSGSSQEDEEESAEDESEEEERNGSKERSKKTAATTTSKAPKSAQLNVVVNWMDSEQAVGTITFTTLSGAARCLRCATQEFFHVQNGKEQSWKCKKCSTMQNIKFESVLGHQNSNIFGHVYPVGCRPVDCILLSSILKVACMNCSKDFNVEALPYGTPSQSWCRQCNAKIRFVIQSILFQGQFNAIPEGEKGAATKAPKKKNLKDDIMLTIGQALPKNGTCKHYGKSFRWFRFPCCGKLYPCDECHSANEKDHEMKLANRMVCGFCSTEQPFSKESCKHCKNDIIKTKSSFWEGGKGCRNQVAMSKNDVKKYKNKAKTIPTKRTGPEAKQQQEKEKK